jgi:2-hydroxychromene-2-carboxylate isomerase
VSLSADLEKARLSVLLDVRHPLAYLAFQPTVELASSLGVEVNWLPLTVPPLNPPSEQADGDDRGIRHRRYRAQAIGREIEAYAAAQGLVLRDYYRNEETPAANLGWLWVRDRFPAKLEAYLAGLLHGYWTLVLDASSAAAVSVMLEALNADGAAFLEWSAAEGPVASARLAEELRDHGLFQVPAYVVEDEVFYGRQHLPMIRWILAGRSGPTPI